MVQNRLRGISMINLKGRIGLIIVLIITLVSLSYLNYFINNKSLLETSTELERYEEQQMDNLNDPETLQTVIVDPGAINDGNTSSITMVEHDNNVIDSKQSEIEDVMATTSENIQDSIEANSLGSSNYFLQAKIDISMERERTLSRFDEVINNTLVDEDTRKKAANKKLVLIEMINKEQLIENIIKTKGFEDAVVFVTSERVYVTVQSDEINKQDIAKLLDIVTGEIKYPIDNIIIQNK